MREYRLSTPTKRCPHKKNEAQVFFPHNAISQGILFPIIRAPCSS